MTTRREQTLANLAAALAPGARVLDVGCGEFGMLTGLGVTLGRFDVSGCDIAVPDNLPAGANFQKVDLDEGRLPYDDDSFQLVIFSHVIEHLRDPLTIFAEIIRVLAPGGRLYIECPSERSVRQAPWFPAHWNLILSFYDDPTHIGRPWSPQSLRRLALFHGTEPEATRYDQSFLRALRLPFDWLWGIVRRDPDHLVTSWWRAIGWVAYAVIRKPDGLSGAPRFNYYSFKGRSIGPRFDRP